MRDKQHSGRTGLLMRIVVSLLLMGLCTAALSARAEAPKPTLTVYVVRHAEKAAGSSDPGLSPRGRARAEELSHVLSDAGIRAVFVSEFKRTQQTGAPVALAAGISTTRHPAGDIKGLVATLLDKHGGERVLVVGHSNTVDDIATALGAPGLSDLSDDQYDRLYVVHRLAGEVTLERLRYGAKTP
jgi:broad specificity phosphatase PhoE